VAPTRTTTFPAISGSHGVVTVPLPVPLAGVEEGQHREDPAVILFGGGQPEFVVSEALANAAKDSQATEVWVAVGCDGPGAGRGVVLATVAGVGGATPERGSGLIGLVDRVEALGGRFRLDSPAGRGTKIAIELPLGTRALSEPPRL
jgi:glucose-6-phosphate-specific signal transduction histidine kinase